jgi:AcrR family transcriptional regulator
MDRDSRWEDIVNAAGKIFEQKGYQAASLQDIASEVGILKGSMYYYIKTKEDLLYELVRRAQLVRIPTLDEDDELRASPAPVRLRAFMARWMGEERVWNRVAEQEFRKLRGRRLTAVIDQRDKFSEFVKSIIRQGIKEGDFDPSVDPSVASNAIFTLMNTTRMWFKPTGRMSMAELVDWYATFVITGLGGLDESPRRPALTPPVRGRPQRTGARRLHPNESNRRSIQAEPAAKKSTAGTSGPSRRAAHGGR